MTATPRRTPSVPSRAPICATRWPDHLQHLQNNHAPIPARLFQKSAVRVEGGVFLGFFYSFVRRCASTNLNRIPQTCSTQREIPSAWKAQAMNTSHNVEMHLI